MLKYPVLNSKIITFNIVVINDNSSDSTLEILESFKNQITIINNNVQLGKSASLNKALEAVTTTYTAIVDADSIVEENSLSNLVQDIKIKAVLPPVNN